MNEMNAHSSESSSPSSSPSSSRAISAQDFFLIMSGIESDVDLPGDKCSDFESDVGLPGGSSHESDVDLPSKMLRCKPAGSTLPSKMRFKPAGSTTPLPDLDNESDVDLPSGCCKLKCLEQLIKKPLFAQKLQGHAQAISEAGSLEAETVIIYAAIKENIVFAEQLGNS